MKPWRGGAYLELAPFTALETSHVAMDDLWLRGGFPESLPAPSPARSLRWRQDFIRTYLERDVPMLGPRIPAETLRRFWSMLAHHQGGLLNVAQFARNLGVDAKTAAAYLDLLVDLLFGAEGSNAPHPHRFCPPDAVAKKLPGRPVPGREWRQNVQAA